MDDADQNGEMKSQSPVEALATASADPASAGAMFPGGLAFYPGNPTAMHPYSIFAGQGGMPLVYGGPFYGGILPYGFPAPAPTLPADDRPAEPSGTAAQDSGQTDGSGERLDSDALQQVEQPILQQQQQRLASLPQLAGLRTTSISSQQHESPQARQSSFAMLSPDAGASSSGAAALAALAAAQAQMAGTDLRQAAELWRQRSALGSTGELTAPSLDDRPQDDREHKRMRRKQSNRESARRSRLRKQAECESLSGRVDELLNDNVRLREENRLLQAKVDTLTSQQADVDDRVRQKLSELVRMPEAGERGSGMQWALSTRVQA